MRDQVVDELFEIATLFELIFSMNISIWWSV